MNRPDLPLYQLDFTAKVSSNAVNMEYGKRPDGANNNLVIPLQAPFYQESVKLYHMDGTLMDYEVDYDFYGILSQLTAYTAKDVGLFVRLLKPEITEFLIDYQVVGNFNKLTKEILDMVRVVAQDDRPVDWDNIDNKPLWFDPEIHLHDYTYNFFGFQDLAKQLLRIQEYSSQFNNGVQIQLDAFQLRVDSYIDQYRSVLVNLLDAHDASLVDPHGVWKTQIGLADVDNFKTATLAEVLAGTRDDLHMRPFDAIQAIDMVAASNERLFPSGTLPLLRYGVDSYIPPKIDGSFEGMGGQRQAIAGVIENDNSLVVLQARDNGTVRGLYYFRCVRWETDRPVWEFTGYRYNHPTATAAGAVLDTVVSGSNQYVMVVGDSRKNLWWWCETFGTMDPKRHVLRPVTNAWTGDWADNTDGRLYVLADENYREFFAIGRAAHGNKIVGTRKEHPMPPGDRAGDGLMFYPCFAMGPIGPAATIDFKIPNIKNYMDEFFTPHEQILDANGKVIQGLYKPTIPLQSFWYYHGHHLQMRKMKEPTANGDTRWAFTCEIRCYYRTADLQKDGTLLGMWRGAFTAKNGVKPVLSFAPGTGEKVYNINPVDPGSSPDWSAFLAAKSYPYNVSSGSYSGNAIVGGKYRITMNAANQATPPCEDRVFVDPAIATGEAMISPIDYKDVGIVNYTFFDERNPAGQGIGFMYQYIGCSDSDDPNSGVVFARQQVSTKMAPNLPGTEWVGRPIPFLNSNWHGDNSRLRPMTIGGKTVNTFPLQPKSFKSNLGPAVLISVSAQTNIARANRRETWKNIFGADAYTRIDGKVINNGLGLGDGKLIVENTIKTVGGVVTYTPTKVYQIDKAIISQIKPMITALGMDTADINKAWTLARVWDDANNPLFVLLITDAAVFSGTSYKSIRGTYAVVRLTPVGSPSTVDGYQYYNDVKFTFVQPFSLPIFTGPGNTRPAPPRGIYGNTESTPVIFTAQNLEGANADGCCMLLSSFHRYNLVGDTRGFDIFIEFDTTWKTTRTKNTSLSNSTYTSYAIDPASGLGMINNNAVLTKGAGIVTDQLHHNGGRFLDAIINNTFGTVPTLGMSNLLEGGYTVYFKAIDNLLIAGKKYAMDGSYQDLRAVDPNPANKTFYVYLKYWQGGPAHVIEPSPVPETSTAGLVAVIRTGPTQIEEIIPYNRFTMVGVQMSADRQGSSIIGARGTIYEIGNASGVLLPGDFLPE